MVQSIAFSRQLTEIAIEAKTRYVFTILEEYNEYLALEVADGEAMLAAVPESALL